MSWKDCGYINYIKRAPFLEKKLINITAAIVTIGILMPAPRPKANESERDFISRCEKSMHEENNRKPESERRSNEQISAICYSEWRKPKKARAKDYFHARVRALSVYV